MVLYPLFVCPGGDDGLAGNPSMPPTIKKTITRKKGKDAKSFIALSSTSLQEGKSN